jgi:hypothetical protein
MTLTGIAPTPTEEEIVVLQHDSAVDFLSVAYPTLRRFELSANIILAHALKCAPAEYVLTECQFHIEADMQLPSPTAPIPAKNFWLTVWSHPAKSAPILNMVLSCLHSSLGDYPIFLWTPVEQSLLLPQWLSHRLGHLVPYLRACVDPERVFAAFGAANIVTAFAEVWTALTGFQTSPEPLYTAFSAFCTPHTFKTPISAATPHVVRRATLIDAQGVGRLCQDFANSSVGARLPRLEIYILTPLPSIRSIP